MPAKPPVMILTVATSFGEVDWILPVLVAFKEKHPEWEIISLFGHKLVFDRFAAFNPVLFKEFKRVSTLNIVPQEINALLEKNISPEQVKIILKDYNPDEYAPYKTTLMERCSNAKVVSYPHSNHIYGNLEQESLKVCSDPDAYSRHDIFLLGSRNDIPYWSEYADSTKIRTLGYPRYDSWWIERFLKAPELTASREYTAARAADKVFFYISRGVHPHYINQKDYEYLVRSMMEDALRYDNSLVLIKPHPRQDITDLERLLAPYDPKRWMISGLHLFQQASLADVIISGWSSGILDALAVGKPVIEFWRFGGNDPLCRRTPDGRFTTIYRELGLAAPADTREELAALLASAMENPGADTWRHQREAFRRHCKFTDNASEAIADLLFDEAAGGETATRAMDAVPKQSALIDAMIEYVAALVDGAKPDHARQWLEFLAGQFPEEPKIFNNKGVFLFNEGDFSGAVNNLTKSLLLNPHYCEAAVNLVQILFALKQVDKAMEVVVSFSTRAPDANLKSEFLRALRSRFDDETFAEIRNRLAGVNAHLRCNP